MKWPWVSRDSAERMISFHETNAAGWKLELELAIARYANELANERERYDALLEKFTALRVQGAVPEPKAQPLPVAIVPPADELRDLVYAKFAGNTRQLGQALAQLARDRADRVSDDTIRAGILNGYSPEGVPA